jgi:hypothetical protein
VQKKDEDNHWKNSARRLVSVEEEEKREKKERNIVLCSIINGALSNADCIALNGWAMLNNELERIGKEAVVAQFEVTTLHLPRG